MAHPTDWGWAQTQERNFGTLEMVNCLNHAVMLFILGPHIFQMQTFGEKIQVAGIDTFHTAKAFAVFCTCIVPMQLKKKIPLLFGPKVGNTFGCSSSRCSSFHLESSASKPEMLDDLQIIRDQKFYCFGNVRSKHSLGSGRFGFSWRREGLKSFAQPFTSLPSRLPIHKSAQLKRTWPTHPINL